MLNVKYVIIILFAIVNLDSLAMLNMVVYKSVVNRMTNVLRLNNVSIVNVLIHV